MPTEAALVTMAALMDKFPDDSFVCVVLVFAGISIWAL